MADSYAQLVAESLSAIAQQSPVSYSSASHAAGGMTLLISIDDEPLTVVADPMLRVATIPTAATVEARTTSAAITAILNGHCTIEQLVLQDQLQVRGTLDNVARSHDVLLKFVHGAVRSPSVAKLRQRFETHAQALS